MHDILDHDAIVHHQSIEHYGVLIQETQEIMRATSRAANVHENERTRQLEKIEQRKQERKGKKEAHQEVAHEMIREASTVEKR